MNIMIIDDDRQSLNSMESALRLAGFNVCCFDAPIPAIGAYDPKTIDAVISDFHLPTIKGSEIVRMIHKINKDAPVIIVTGYPEKAIELVSLKAGAYAFFKKPLNIEQIIETLRKISLTPAPA